MSAWHTRGGNRALRNRSSSSTTAGTFGARPTGILEYGLAALFAAFVAWPSFLPGRRLLSFDGLAYSGPNVALSTSNWRALRIPQWNDTVFGGVPHLANPQAGVFYPLKFLFLWADPAQMLTLV